MFKFLVGLFFIMGMNSGKRPVKKSSSVSGPRPKAL